jgi:hypothetical protein
MFLHGYSESHGLRDAIAFARVWLIPVLKSYLTDFLKCTFWGENAKNRAFYGGKNQQPRAFTTPELTKAQRHGNRRSVYTVFTSHLGLSRLRTHASLRSKLRGPRFI